MKEEFSRSARLLGDAGIERLGRARVAVFGVGGVGGYAVEALARSGVGTLDLIDADTVSLSNINRQIIALHSTVGKYKVDAARERVLDINPDAAVNTYNIFFTEENRSLFDFSKYDFVIDAIDSVKSKCALIEAAVLAGAPIISSMGAGNKLDPTRFEISDISKTSVCPLARVMRRELRARGINHLTVVYSQEEPLRGARGGERRTPGSVAFVPSVAGLIIASEVVRQLTEEK